MNPLINPLTRNGKFSWYSTFRKHVTMSTSSTNAKLVLVGDSIIANFDKCSNIFDKFFLPFRTHYSLWHRRIDKHCLHIKEKL